MTAPNSIAAAIENERARLTAQIAKCDLHVDMIKAELADFDHKPADVRALRSDLRRHQSLRRVARKLLAELPAA